MPNLTKAQEAKTNNHLSSMIRTPDGVTMTRRQYITQLHEDGYKPIKYPGHDFERRAVNPNDDYEFIELSKAEFNLLQLLTTEGA